MNASPRLSLYRSATCGYSAQVERVAQALDLDVQLRDIADSAVRQELVGARQRATVPVLRIQQEGKQDVWMAESLDIIRYLKKRAGRPDRAPAWLDTVSQVAGPGAVLSLVIAAVTPAPWSTGLLGLGAALFVAAALRRVFAMAV